MTGFRCSFAKISVLPCALDKSIASALDGLTRIAHSDLARKKESESLKLPLKLNRLSSYPLAAGSRSGREFPYGDFMIPPPPVSLQIASATPCEEEEEDAQ